MKKVFLCIAVSIFSSFSVIAEGQNCNPTAKYYCACEDLTHGAFWQISFMELNFATGKKRVISALKPYNVNPIYRKTQTSEDLKTYSDCVLMMKTYPECQ